MKPGADAPLVGTLNREALLAAPRWREAFEGARADASSSLALASVPPGAEVEVVLGTWCGDSRREVTRFWRALDALGRAPPFGVRYVGVDRSKNAPGGVTDGLDIRFVPTFIVRRAGAEIGRIIESAPGGIESDLLALLTGARRGAISGRTDL